MLRTEDNDTNTKLLKKVRRPFLNKTPDSNEPAPETRSAYIPKEKGFNILNSCLGLVEKNNKIYIGAQFLNSFLTIISMKIDNLIDFRSLTVNIQIQKEYEASTWEHNVTKLETSGNKETYRIGVAESGIITPSTLKSLSSSSVSLNPTISKSSRDFENLRIKPFLSVKILKINIHT